MICGLLAILGLFLKPLNATIASAEIGFSVTASMLGLFNFGFCAAVFVVVPLIFPDKPEFE